MNNKVPKDQGFWNAVFMGAFVLIAAVVFWVLTDGLTSVKWFYFMNTFDVVMISLATFRGVRLVSYDKVFAFVREYFLDKGVGGKLEKPKGGPRRTVVEILECLWCTGLWSGLAMVTLYFISGFGRFLVIVFAISAAGSFLQNLAHRITRVGEK